MEVKTKSPKETQKVGQELAKDLQGGDTVALFGELGAGKTVFVQGIAKGLKIKRNIVSPTFVFMRSYPFIKSKRELTFYHIDLFRGQVEKDFESLGLSEIFSPDSVVVLEWANRIKSKLPKKRIDVYLNVVNENVRKIKITRSK